MAKSLRSADSICQPCVSSDTYKKADSGNLSERQEYRSRLLELEKLGVRIGRDSDLWSEPNRIILEQNLPPLAGIYELPSGMVVVIVPAKLTLLAGILLRDAEMTTPWDLPLELSVPEGNSYYQNLMNELAHSPQILNHWLTHHAPVSRRQEEGVIIAHGWGSVPSKCHDEMLITVKLFFIDEQGDEICFDFNVRVDRSLRRRYERQQRERKGARLTERVPLFKRKDKQAGDEKGFGRKTPSSRCMLTMDVTQLKAQGLQKPS